VPVEDAREREHVFVGECASSVHICRSALRRSTALVIDAVCWSGLLRGAYRSPEVCSPVVPVGGRNVAGDEVDVALLG